MTRSTRSRSAALLDGPAPPSLRVAPSARDNSWEDVADLSASLGMPLDEWQEQALEAAMGERSDGRWASKFVGISAPRQNGKSQLIVARALAGVLLFDEKMVIISAHETDTAREVWKRLLDVVEANPSLEARVTGRMDAINREFLTFGKGTDRQTIKLKARRASGTRGFSADCLLLDEAQILGKAAWGSIVPTMSARENPQLWLFGTPPTDQDDPFAFARLRESAKSHKARHAWMEWSAAPGDDYDDPETWAKANPAFGVRISAEACADDRAAMDNQQFALERLGMWSSRGGAAIFGEGHWQACAGPMPDGVKIAGLGIACSYSLTHSAILAVGFDADGVLHGKPLQHGYGIDWAPARAKELQDKHGVPVGIDGKGPAAVLIPRLVAAEVELQSLTFANVQDACADFEAKVRSRAFRHDEYPELESALTVAVKRFPGDRWVLGRKQSSSDISALEALIVASFVAARPVEKPKRSAYEDHGVMTI